MTRLLTHVAMFGVLLIASQVAQAAPGGQQAPPPTPPTPPTEEAPLNLNTATAESLQLLPGVGPAMAARILEYREANGGFTKIEELMNVRGIGEKTFLKLKPLVVVPPGGRPIAEA